MTTRPTLTGTFGMVSSTHWLASASAQAVLERGGNAVDAAVAGAFVLHVVEPHLNGAGGDLIALVSTPENPEPRIVMGQGPAPKGATIERFRKEALDLVPGAGALAAAIPGAVDAWLLLLRDEGTMDPAEVLSYAIDYAKNGHPVVRGVVDTIARVEQLFRDDWPESAEQWLPGGRVPDEGEIVRLPAYARTLERLLAAAPENASRAERIDAMRKAWSQGFVARAIDEFVKARPRRHSTGGVHRGVITRDDLAGWAARIETAVSAEFRGFRVFKQDAAGQGPALLMALRILNGLPDEAIDPRTERGIHTIVETMKLVLADRDAYFGDGDVDLTVALSDEYATARRALIAETSSLEWRPGEWPGRSPFRPPLTPPADGQVSTEPTVDRSGHTKGDTCHIDVVDRDGRMVSATPSGGWLQSSPHIPELGFCLGTRLQMTWLDADAPSALQPGKRPRTTLTPTIVTKNGRAVLACGSPGGDQQDQWQLPFLIRVLAFGMGLQEAIDAPNFHTAAMVDSFWPRTFDAGSLLVEERVGDGVIAALCERGHRVNVMPAWSLGRLCAVARDPETGVVFAGANPRGMQGYAVGR